MPSEPPLSQGDGIAKIRFRLPSGENIERRFQATTPLKVLFDFLTVKGFPKEEFKVISSWPRRDVGLLKWWFANFVILLFAADSVRCESYTQGFKIMSPRNCDIRRTINSVTFPVRV